MTLYGRLVWIGFHLSFGYLLAKGLDLHSLNRK